MTPLSALWCALTPSYRRFFCIGFKSTLIALGIIINIHSPLSAQDLPNLFPATGRTGIGTGLLAPVKPLHILTTAGSLMGDPAIRLSYGTGLEAPAENFFAHLVLKTPNNGIMPDYPSCRGWNSGGPSNASVGDLMLVNGTGRTWPIISRDVIISALDPSGNLRFSTTPLEGSNDIERMTITPDGKVGINTISPLGYLDINMADGWAENLPKISFSHNGNNPQMRFYRITGVPSIPYLPDRHEAFAWYIEQGQEQFQGALQFRAGTGGVSVNPPFRNLIGTETTEARVTFLSNGNVGINEAQPISKLQVKDGAVLFNGTIGATPTDWSGNQLGMGTRLMWIPDKAAFRAGKLDDEYVDFDNILSPGEDAFTFWNTSEIGANSIAMGLNCKAKGPGSVAMGWMNVCHPMLNSDGHCAIALGHYNFVDGNDGVALGFDNRVREVAAFAAGEKCHALGKWSRAIGYYADATSQNSNAIGSYISATSQAAFVFGTGIAYNQRLVNNVSNSLRIGFNSDKPTMTVTGGNGNSGSFGTVGIGTTSPSCTFGVNGTACVGWGGTGVVPSGSGGATVGMIVEDAVIIGGTGTPPAPAYVTSGARSGTSSMLQVWGDAIKLAATTSAWDIPSDARYKKEVRPFTDGLEQLRQINPVRFRYNDELGIKQSDEDGIGVLAQDIQKVLPYTVHENSLNKSVLVKEEKRYQIDAIDTVYSDEHDHGTTKEFANGKREAKYIPTKKWVTEPAEYRTESKPLLTYNSSSLTYVIINAIKEMDAARLADKTTNDSLRLVVQNLHEHISRLEASNSVPLTEPMDVILEQNNPNPFSDNASITYYIPEKVNGKAEILIGSTDQNVILKQFPLEKGKPAQLYVDAKDFKTGVYVYSLAVNGKILAAKKLIIIK